MNAKSQFSKGLQAGFGGRTVFDKVTRGSFELTSSHHDSDGVYHDEWVSGGGQELIRTADGEAYTRVYVGNVISKEKLTELGIEEGHVMSFLKQIITQHGEHIRFDKEHEFEDKEWRYLYKTTYLREDPFVVNGIEEIFYKDTSVFVHTFGISKVVEG